MSREELPRFAHLPGQLVWARQLQMRYVTDMHFFFHADEKALQRTINLHLNQSMGIRGRFKVACPFVAIHYQNCSCADLRCAPHHWQSTVCPVKHCARAWITDAQNQPVAALKFNRMEFALFVADKSGRVYRYVPYSFVDDGTALAAFRETLGLKMNLGHFDLPTNGFKPEKPGRIACHAHMDKIEAPNLWVDNREHMADLEPVGEAREAPVWKSHSEVWAGIAADLRTNLWKRGHKHHHHLQYLIQAAFQSHFGLSLKQFRGMPDGVKAFYKALVSYGLKNTRLHAGGFLGRHFELTFPASNTVIENTFPIAKDLGLNKKNTSVGAYWTRSDSQYYLQEIVDDIREENHNRL